MDFKKHRTLLILLALFIVLILSFLALSSYERQQKNKGNEAEAQIPVIRIDTLSSLSYTDHNNETTLSFTKDSETWYVSDDKEIPLTQSYIDTMEETFCSINATREITDPDALSDYGLDNPAYTIKLTDQEGNLTTLTIGNAADEDYYLAVNGQEDILYTVNSSIVSSMQYDLDTMVTKDTLPSIGSGNLIQADITENGTTTTYSSEDDEQTERFSTVAGGYGAMTLTDLASYHATTEELTSFGLDEDSKLQ